MAKDYDVEELACAVLGIDYEDENTDVEQVLKDWRGISLFDFEQIATKLLDMVRLDVSLLTDKALIGFAADGQWIAKKDFNNPFVANIITWLTSNEKMDKGFSRTVRIGGVPTYEITIKPVKPKTESEEGSGENNVKTP